VYAEIPEHRAEDGVLDRVESVLFSAHDEAVSVPGGLAQRRGEREALSVVELAYALYRIAVRDEFERLRVVDVDPEGEPVVI
jgi:hypothetical protein